MDQTEFHMVLKVWLFFFMINRYMHLQNSPSPGMGLLMRTILMWMQNDILILPYDLYLRDNNHGGCTFYMISILS